ncbi:hypothetical protein [uncultured Sphingomonas sp.]|uniref:hypothetical protein n=1 Tax=uncultured Sphingomonas sp. TaxID=158754 RepID=UPI0035CAC45D
MMLFLRGLTRLRSAPKFLPLCAEIGIIDYRRAADVRPDFLNWPSPVSEPVQTLA